MSKQGLRVHSGSESDGLTEKGRGSQGFRGLGRVWTILGYRWRYYSLQYLAIIYNSHYCSGIFSGKTEKMAAGCDDFWVIFGIFSHLCVIHHYLITENKLSQGK